MKAVVAFFFGALLCAAQKPANCFDSPEHAQQCLEAGDAEAEFLMGAGYDMGIGGYQQDFKQAMKWYRLAALQGHLKAQLLIGLLYARGNGVPQDYAEAFRWYHSAAESGLARARASVGSAYLFGQGVPQNYKEALDWLGKAAERGDLVGEFGLGLMYESGQGVPQDYVLAHMWLNLASAQACCDVIGPAGGNDEARKYRDEVAAKMTAAQIAEAQRLAREFKPKAP